MGKRMVKSCLYESEKIEDCSSDSVRLLFVWLCISCDDDGKMQCRPKSIKSKFFGYREDMSINEVENMLIELGNLGLILYYEDKKTKERFAEIPGWKEVNVIRKDCYKKSDIPSYSHERNEYVTDPIQSRCTVKYSKDKISKVKNSIVSLSGKPDHEYKEIIDDLNSKAGTNYKNTTPKTKGLITLRLNEGFTREDFFIVHSNMVKAWQHDTKMAKFIRPITLYSNKFESYLNHIVGTGLQKHAGIMEWVVDKEKEFADNGTIEIEETT